MSDLKGTHIYIIAHKGPDGSFSAPVKVGITGANVEKRVRTLQTGNPNKIGMLFAFIAPSPDIARWMEESFHKIAAKKRLSGEWFDMPPRKALGLLYSCIYLSIANEVTDPHGQSVLADYCGLPSAETLFESLGDGVRH